MEENTIIADTLTPPTVGRLSVMRIGRQSAHSVCDFSCFLESADCIKTIIDQLYFFFDRPTVFGIWQLVWSRATVCRLSADSLPITGRPSTDS